MSQVYAINKGVNATVEFKGLKAQWIWRLAAGLVMLLILFTLLYIAGVHAYICVGFALCSGAGLFIAIYRLNDRYGQYGLMKNRARQSLPFFIQVQNREVFHV